MVSGYNWYSYISGNNCGNLVNYLNSFGTSLFKKNINDFGIPFFFFFSFFLLIFQPQEDKPA